ncbi:hypothetical protein SUGI_0251260 [Cryptomeria japonica]|nr:hypothetical protein SUGI_0251260 [Cryptomeria japonica]
MVEKRIVPNIASYSIAIEILSKEGSSIKANELLEEMVKSGLNPCATTYLAVLGANLQGDNQSSRATSRFVQGKATAGSCSMSRNTGTFSLHAGDHSVASKETHLYTGYTQ